MKNQKTTFLILGLLSIDALTGYEMKKLMEESISHFWSESNGQLYPALSQLKKDQLIELSDTQHKGKQISHRYAITSKGRAALEQWLGESTEMKLLQRDEELLKLFFGKNASYTTSIELLKKRQQRVQKKLDQFLAIHKEIEQYTDSPHYLYWLLSLKNGICRAEAEVQWCQESIQTIQDHHTTK